MILAYIFGLLVATSGVAKAVELTGYEYVIVGSGAGGGPLAARLALAGHKTLLIEAGDDQGETYNYTIPAYSARASEDEKLSWNFFVHHYEDDERQARDWKTSYDTPDGGIYTGLNPPAGSTLKGTLYPRTGTLGGCTAHNALIAVYPYQSDFEYIQTITNDSSWAPDNMRKYFTKLENNGYSLPAVEGHGYDGWLSTETAPLSIVLEDTQLLSLLTGGAYALGNTTDQVMNLGTLLVGDANADTETRDTEPGYYQIPISTDDAHRNGAREFIISVRDATNDDGSKKYPLDVRMNTHVTKVTFNETETPPRATGVEFLDGEHLYRASPMSNSAVTGTPGSATASREVIVAGGVYNSPQILKLSGIGPAEELEKFGIKVIKDLPGVGTNLQDHYEISVQGKVEEDFSCLNKCTFSIRDQADPCISDWESPVLGDHGIYSSPGLAATMLYKSSTATDDFDIFEFGGPVNFRGYFPDYSINATDEHNWFTWAILKSHPRNSAGNVVLQSADPLDMPKITFNYFDTGVGDYEADLTAMYEAIQLARDAFKRQTVNITEVLPGADVQSKEDIIDYIKDGTWGHHASCTCPIGADDDTMAVLDSKFRVRGVSGLRVVDASVFPKVPGTFTAVSTYMVAEKAADEILSELEASS
ncbi:CAZyme family AA3 [Penicillium psychrosexuale]|uniref:CAZyme family AA3 n=1 Tax=Penicillium psychrosexuale TaxID=1002107 RepID=UPI0025451F9C|nr:CAZyme family AA3 [Penicillium psychrosexuale]KAJ5783604.1 CAZyme family AA3 [Penicillium psychrosexuale]